MRGYITLKTENLNMKKILIALDYSEATNKVVNAGAQLAKAFGAEVVLVHVLSEVTYYSSLNYSPIIGFDSFSNMDIVQTSAIEDVRNAAGEFLKKVKEQEGLPNADVIVREGDFADEILITAEDSNAGVIVMGSHSRRGIDKILMGSVAEKVLHKSDVPVYIIPIRKS